MIRAGFSAILSHWRRNLLQLFSLVFGLALATALWSGVQAINAEARASYDAAATTLGEGQYDQILPRSGNTISQDQYIALRRAGWQVTPVLDGALGPIRRQVRLLGFDPLTAPAGLMPVGQGEGQDIVGVLTTRFVFVNPNTADLLPEDPTLQVIIDDAVAPGVAITDIGVAQQLLDSPAQINRLIVANIQPLNVLPLDQIAPELFVKSAIDGQDVQRLTDSFHLNLTAFGLLSFAVGIFIVQGVIGLAFEQRRSLVRTLRALGMPLRVLIWLFVGELIAFAFVAGALGVVMGYLIAAVLLPDVAATLRGLYGADVVGALQLRPVWWGSGFAIAFGGTAIAAGGALWKIARMPILASARPRAWAVESNKNAALLALAAIALLATALVLAIWGRGLLVGFVLLGCLLTGAALALPYFLFGVVSLGRRFACGPISEWFWADTRQQVPGLSLALMALLLATAANVGVSTMVSSFRETFVGFLDQRLAPELFVSVSNDEQAKTLDVYLSEHAREVLPVVSTDIQVADVPTALFGVRVVPTYEENWRFLKAQGDVWSLVKAGQAAIINEQLARRADLWPGDMVQILPNLTLPIAAVVADYGNPLGQVVINEAQFLQRYPDQRAQRFGVRTDDPVGLRQRLMGELSIETANIVNQAQIKAFSLGVFERTFKVTGALNILTLAVAAFAILMSLLTLSAMRIPQLAPAWALGMTRRELGKLELIRAVVLAALTTILALPLGLLLAWVLLSIVNVEAFGWALPMFLFPALYVRLGVFALVAAAVAAMIPARRLAYTPPGTLLKVFANDR
ncbi:MAG: ABC transporter permease [Paracoccaceae bacterium]